MTTFQRPFEEEGDSLVTGPAMISEELYLNLGDKPALPEEIPAISSLFFDEAIESHNNHIDSSREMSRSESEIVVKIEGVDVDASPSISVSNVSEKYT